VTQTHLILALQPPNPNITIRPVRFADVDALRTNCWPERDPDSIYRFIGRIRHTNKDGRGLGAVVMDRTRYAVGYGQFVLWPRCGEVSDLIISPQLRSQGLGTALIQYLVRGAQEMHADCIEIGAALSNPGAVNLYRRMGFRDSYTQVVNLNGHDEEVLYLRIKFPRG
jgi:ribosomal protein S18 acetylase RimI-like enzyme